MKKDTERVSAQDACKLLGICGDTLRYNMRKNLFVPPIGRVYRSKSGKSYRYLISRTMLNEYLGRGETNV